MGKKRRLKSAKAKFSAKHSSHPRARFLAKKAQEVPKLEIAEEIKVADLPVEVENSTPEATLRQENPEPPVEGPPLFSKVKSAPTTKKKKATRSRKSTTKKKTTSIPA